LRQSITRQPSDRNWNGNHLSLARDRGLLPWLDWKFSLIFPLAILLLAVTLIFRIANQTDYLEVIVTDQTTGNALEGAFVTIGDRRAIPPSVSARMGTRPFPAISARRMVRSNRCPCNLPSSAAALPTS
jgi:hypothetical protein